MFTVYKNCHKRRKEKPSAVERTLNDQTSRRRHFYCYIIAILLSLHSTLGYYIRAFANLLVKFEKWTEKCAQQHSVKIANEISKFHSIR